MGLDDLKKNLNNKCDCGKKDCEKCNTKPSKRKFNKFSDWIAPVGLSAEEIESYQLIYGVAMSEGTMKGDEVMTAENVISATGALAASAFFGYADIDIDHYAYGDNMPEEYVKKYGKELIETYPPAFTIDAQASKNKVDGVEGEIYQSEYFGVCENKHVYDMIKAGKFKGCSVVDYYRRDNCSHCNDDTGKCECITEGSKFLYHTLILDEVPNSNATWVAAVTKDNIADLFDFSDEETVEAFKNKINSIKEKRNTLKAQNALKKHELAEYKSDDGWISEKSAQEFLENEKGIESELAAEIAAFITESPDLLNDYQLEYLSMEDIIAWYQAAQGNKNFHALRHNLAVKKYLIDNAKNMQELREMTETMNKFVPFGQGEVDYMGNAENQCAKCRFFVESDDGIGDCVIVAGEVAASGGCNKWDEAPGMADPDDPDNPDDPNDPDNPDTPTDPDAPSDPDDPSDDDDPEEVEPNADGTCPDGYEINADGTMCVKVTMAPASGKKTLKDLRKTAQSKVKPKVTIEANPDDAIKVNAVLDAQINGIEKQIIEHEVIFPGDTAHIQQAKLEDLRKELRRLQSLKKKSVLG